MTDDVKARADAAEVKLSSYINELQRRKKRIAELEAALREAIETRSTLPEDVVRRCEEVLGDD